MPKNTYLIENYKKVEEIREIKNEIPTYEEFLENYRADRAEQEVSNSYENELNSYSDIGVSKGFGPCYYSNPNCPCYVSQSFVSLYTCCPSCSNKDVCVWTHSNARLATSDRNSNCRGNLLVSEYLRIKCSDCNEEGNWREWMFSCSQHNGYKYTTSYMAFMDSLVIGLRIQASNPTLADLVKRI